MLSVNIKQVFISINHKLYHLNKHLKDFEFWCILLRTLNFSKNCFFINIVIIFVTLLCAFLAEGDETGVMDSLMEALQSGAAFRDRRKRTPRTGTNINFYYLHVFTFVTHTSLQNNLAPQEVYCFYTFTTTRADHD